MRQTLRSTRPRRKDQGLHYKRLAEPALCVSSTCVSQRAKIARKQRRVEKDGLARWFPDDEAVLAAAAQAEAEALAKRRTVARQLTHYLSIARVETSTKKGYESAANNYLSVLCKALHVAMLDKLIDANVAANDELRSDYQEPEPDPFDVQEVERILAYMCKSYPEPVFNLCDFWAHTGLRTSEIYGALWPAIDWHKQTLLVHRSNVRDEEKESTKTKSTRNLPINSKAMAALKRQKAHTFLRGRHIFLDLRYAAPWDDERAFRRSYWTPTLKALGIRYRSPYQLRHTFATMMLMAGVTPAAAAKRMGHSVQMFLSRYTKWIDGDLDALQDLRLETFLSGPAVAAVAGS